MGLFGVLYVFAVALYALSLEKKGFKGGFAVLGALLAWFGALRGF